MFRVLPSASQIPMAIECHVTREAQAFYDPFFPSVKEMISRPTLSPGPGQRAQSMSPISTSSRHTFTENNDGRRRGKTNPRTLARARKLENSGAPRRKSISRSSLACFLHRAPPHRRPSSFLRECPRDGRGLRLLFAPPETLSRVCPFFPDVSLPALLPRSPLCTLRDHRFSPSDHRRAKYLARKGKTGDVSGEERMREPPPTALHQRRRKNSRSREDRRKGDAIVGLKAERKWHKFSDRHCGG